MASRWIVYYHSGFSGRAQGLDLMLVDAGVAFERGSKADCMARSDGSVFALPAVHNTETGRILSQTTAAASWLGGELGYAAPAAGAPEALKLACDCADVWAEGYAKRNEARTTKDPTTSLTWLTTRFVGFAKAMEATQRRSAVAEARAGPYLLGAAPCWVDFLWANAVITMEWCFGIELVATSLSAAPLAMGAAAALRARPRVEAYLASAEPVLYSSVNAETFLAMVQTTTTPPALP